MESSRSAPKIAIHGHIARPGGKCSAVVYDTANHDWHGVEVEITCRGAEEKTTDITWLSCIIEEHLRRSYVDIREDPDHEWSADETDCQNNSYTIRIWPRSRVLFYGHRTDIFQPTALDIKSPQPLGHRVYRCSWKGQECVLKYIETDTDVGAIELEIEKRKDLINKAQIPANQVNSEMSRRFCLVPILAVVVADWQPRKPNTVVGILMPYAGEDLGILAKNSGGNLPITLQQLQDLVRGVRELRKYELFQGDIRPWNTLLQPSTTASKPRLMLIDIDMELPGYPGDAKALGKLLRWCLENSMALSEDKQAKIKLINAVKALLSENFDMAIDCLTATEQSMRRAPLSTHANKVG
ncbi:Protein kinase-like domain protein [Metarhizium brunneum]